MINSDRLHVPLMLITLLVVVAYVWGDTHNRRVGYQKYIGVSNVCHAKNSFYFDSEVDGLKTIRLIGNNLHSLTVEEETKTKVDSPCIEIWYDSERRQKLNVLFYTNVSYGEQPYVRY